jgi:prolyl oligopeptidase
MTTSLQNELSAIEHPVSRAPIEPLIDTYHGFEVTDPYRWLEDGQSPRTREWLETQNGLWREYLRMVPARERIKERISELLCVDTCEPPQKIANRYFFRKRKAEQEQPSIYMREGASGEDELLVDPASCNSDKYTSVKIVSISRDGKLLAYEVKHGGEYSRAIEILDVDRRTVLEDRLPRGFLRTFFFSAGNEGFYYVHESLNSATPAEHVAYEHLFGTDASVDRKIFSAGDDPLVRLVIRSSDGRHGLVIVQSRDSDSSRTSTDLYLLPLRGASRATLLSEGIKGRFGPVMVNGRLFAITEQDAPNSRIVEIELSAKGAGAWHDVVPESAERIQKFNIVAGKIFVRYTRSLSTVITSYNLSGKRLGDLPLPESCTAGVAGASPDSDELFIQLQSFKQPAAIIRYRPDTGETSSWAQKQVPFDGSQYASKRVSLISSDGTRVPMFLVGRNGIFNGKPQPTILTSYGGFGRSMTPEFGIFTSFMMEQGCIFALPNIRGGGEFGIAWHEAGKRRNRQNSFDDFIAAAEWLISCGYTTSWKLAIFGGCNSGLLVAAALTQRPDLFRVGLCLAPLLDMLRYHRFDFARNWADEYGTADNKDDFLALRAYSPYHNVREKVPYPAVLIISGDSDMKVNPMHARKMTARLQAATTSDRPILLDYSALRGHSPVLPLSVRIEALTDRVAFVCNELGLETKKDSVAVQ